MTITVKDVKVDIQRTHHENHWVGATFTWPDGKKTYGEYRSLKEALDRAVRGRDAPALTCQQRIDLNKEGRTHV